MTAYPAPGHSPGLAATVSSLLGLIGHAGTRGKGLVLTSIALTAGAAAVDGASLALLRRTLGGGVPGGSSEVQAAVGFLLVALAAAGLRLVAQRHIVRAQLAVGNALAMRAFRSLQGQPYSDFLQRGASEGFAAFERLQTVTFYGVNQLIAGAAAALSAIAILFGVALLYPLAAGLLSLLPIVILIEAMMRGGQRTKTAGLSDLARDRAHLLFEARTGFRHMYLANGQDRICADFARVEAAYRNEQARVAIAGQSSRHTIEIVGVLAALAVLGAIAVMPVSSIATVPLFAVIALAIFRLLPQLAALRSACRLIGLHADVTDDVRELVERPVKRGASLPGRPVLLRRAIVLRGVTLARPDRPVTLDGLDLMIPRGGRIGIRGESGIGKSSLLDILCGAIAPNAGSVSVDDLTLDSTNGVDWRERIGVVSQNPVLLGATLREAVVFPEYPGVDDAGRLAAALAAAGVTDMVTDFPLGLDTPVGEASSLLSGGQRQRLALAHALYRARDLLVLDEATGQLDPESEAAIISAVAALPRDLTIVVASHRAAAFACCDTVYQLAAGKLIQVNR